MKTGTIRPLLSRALASLLLPALLSSCTEIFSEDISETEIVLLSPTDSLFTGESTVIFWWEEDSEVEKYRVQYAQPDFSAPVVLYDTLLVDDRVELTLEEGKTTWRVQGKNEGSETAWSTRTFFVDLTAPDKATALSLSGDTIAASTSDTLRWVSNDQPLSGIRYAVADSIYLSLVNDSLSFTAIGYTGYDGVSEWPVEETGSGLAAGRYFWYIVTSDLAGNRKKSNVYKFTVQ